MYVYYHKGLDGRRVIIFGGKMGEADSSVEISPQDSLYALDVVHFEWSVSKTSGSLPKPRYHHKANVIRNYMVITFGKYNLFALNEKSLCLNLLKMATEGFYQLILPIH